MLRIASNVQILGELRLAEDQDTGILNLPGEMARSDGQDMDRKHVSQREEMRLVFRSRSGDRNAFRELYERYRERVFRLVYGVLGSHEDAEDVTQETFVKAYLSLPSFKGHSAFYTWLYRIGYNMALDYKRRVKRQSNRRYEPASAEEADQIIEQAADEVTPDTNFVRKERAQQIQQALLLLSEEHRTVVMLREIDGLQYDEIADVTGVSKGTVMSRLHYARKKLQEVLAEIAPDDVAKGDLGRESVVA
jgi:RNA polymerase sigma-70 factor (ECF subfamily)